MIDIVSILVLLLFQWISDFIFQNNYMAINKGKSFMALITHTLVQSSVMIWSIIVLMFLGKIEPTFYDASFIIAFCLFFTINLVSHTIIDYITSRVETKLYKENKIRKFFRVVGFDQFLHYSVTFISFLLLFKPYFA